MKLILLFPLEFPFINVFYISTLSYLYGQMFLFKCRCKYCSKCIWKLYQKLSFKVFSSYQLQGITYNQKNVMHNLEDSVLSKMLQYDLGY